MKVDGQLDLFSASANSLAPGPPGAETLRRIAWGMLDDDSLVTSFAHAGMRDSLALAAEAGRRRLALAIPALEALCRRFVGFGFDRFVPEQAAALDALAMIGGPEAAQTVARLIANSVVQGPSLQKAAAIAARFRAKLPSGVVLGLLRHDDPEIRADACRCVRPVPEAIRLLRDLLDDLHSNVRTAAACALGRMGHGEARSLLARCLREQPSAELIEAVTRVADEDCIVLIARIARAATNLSEIALDALDQIDHPRAEKIATAIRQKPAT